MGPDGTPGFWQRDFRITTQAGQGTPNIPSPPANGTDSPHHTDRFLKHPEKMSNQRSHSQGNTWGHFGALSPPTRCPRAILELSSTRRSARCRASHPAAPRGAHPKLWSLRGARFPSCPGSHPTSGCNGCHGVPALPAEPYL